MTNIIFNNRNANITTYISRSITAKIFNDTIAFIVTAKGDILSYSTFLYFVKRRFSASRALRPTLFFLVFFSFLLFKLVTTIY
jgi:hypothetical protein